MGKLMGFKGKLLCGAAGNTPSEDAILKARDVNYTIDKTDGDVSDRSTIYDMVDVASVKVGLQFELNNDDTSTLAANLRTAAINGTPIAIRTRDKANGWGINADWVISLAEDQPLKDAQRMKFTASLTDAAGRTPSPASWGSGA